MLTQLESIELARREETLNDRQRMVEIFKEPVGSTASCPRGINSVVSRFRRKKCLYCGNKPTKRYAIHPNGYCHKCNERMRHQGGVPEAPTGGEVLRKYLWRKTTWKCICKDCRKHRPERNKYVHHLKAA